MRPMPLLGLAAVLLLGGCGDDAPEQTGTRPPTSTAAATPEPTPAPTPADTAAPTATPTPGDIGAPVALDAECTLEPRQEALPQVVLSHPGGWRVTDPDAQPCTLFDPRNPEVEPRTEVTGVAILVNVDAVAYEQVTGSSSSLRVTDRTTATVDGRPAVRLEGTTTGAGLVPEGVQRTVWYVDVGQQGTDGTLILSADERDAEDPERAQEVLDAMARSARISG